MRYGSSYQLHIREYFLCDFLIHNAKPWYAEQAFGGAGYSNVHQSLEESVDSVALSHAGGSPVEAEPLALFLCLLLRLSMRLMVAVRLARSTEAGDSR